MSNSPTPITPSDILIDPSSIIKTKWNTFIRRYKVKQPIWLIVALLWLLLIGYFVVDRIQLLQVWERVTWKVINITSYNSRCWGKHKHDCTEYTAYVDFTTLVGQKSEFTVSGWDSYWHNQPISDSFRRIWEPVKVIYDPKNISRVYEDTLWGVWWVPIMTFFFQILSFFSAFTEPKKK